MHREESSHSSFPIGQMTHLRPGRSLLNELGAEGLLEDRLRPPERLDLLGPGRLAVVVAGVARPTGGLEVLQVLFDGIKFRGSVLFSVAAAPSIDSFMEFLFVVF